MPAPGPACAVRCVRLSSRVSALVRGWTGIEISGLKSKPQLGFTELSCYKKGEVCGRCGLKGDMRVYPRQTAGWEMAHRRCGCSQRAGE